MAKGHIGVTAVCLVCVCMHVEQYVFVYGHMMCQFMFVYVLQPVFEHLSAIFMPVLMHYVIEYDCQFVFMH